MRFFGLHPHLRALLTGGGVLLLLLCAGTRVRAEERRPHIVVIKEDAPYEKFRVACDEAHDAVRVALRREGFTPDLREIVIDPRKGETDTIERVGRRHNPEVVVTIGTRVTLLAQRAFPDVPIVFAMVMNPAQSGILQRTGQGVLNVTGAAIDIPYEVQFRKFRAVVPTARRIGVVSDPRRTEHAVAQARKAAAAVGLELVVEQVEKSSDVLTALERLITGNGEPGIDGLWTVADPTVLFPPRNVALIAQRCWDARIPAMGLGREHCEAGYLFALEVDYAENGRQAGTLTAAVLRGEKPENLPLRMPEQVRLLVNRNTAELLDYRIPPDVLRDAIKLK